MNYCCSKNYLFQINESLAKKIFQENNILIDKYINSINRKRRARGADEAPKHYSLGFGVGASTTTDDGPYVSTEFDPVDYELYNGFTISFWVCASSSN